MKKYIPYLFLILIVGYLLFLIRPAILGELTGTFKSTKIPVEYVALEKYISNQDTFFRTFWYPTIQRFAFYSNSHPAIPAQNYFRTVDDNGLLRNLREKSTRRGLQEAGVKYIIVPYDSQGEIFLKDRKYDEKSYLKTIENISSINWLKKIDGFGKIAVFEVSSPKDHFWTNSQTLSINYKFVSPVEYIITVENARVGDTIIFSENYDARWLVRDTNDNLYDWPKLISSNPYENIFNSFTLRKNGNYSLVVYYYPQLLLNYAVAVSFITLIILISILIFGYRFKKW